MGWSCNGKKAIHVCQFLQISCLLYVWNRSAVVANASKNCSLLIKYCWTYTVAWWLHNVSWTDICVQRSWYLGLELSSLALISVFQVQIRKYVLGKSWHMRVEHIFWWSHTPGLKTCSCHNHFYKYFFNSGREDNIHFKCIVTHLLMRSLWICMITESKV